MEQLFGALPAVLKDLEPNAIIMRSLVISAWNRCSGDLLRTRTVPLDFVDRRLLIAVEDKTWQRHLEDLSPQMLVKLNAALGQGTVRFVEFRVDNSALQASRSGKIADSGGGALPDAAASSLTHAAEKIADEALRKEFLSAAAAYLGRQKKN